jgi:hypothetical protein
VGRPAGLIAEVIEARDPYTGGHLWRVSQLSLILAQDAGLAPAAAARVALGGFLHDRPARHQDHCGGWQQQWHISPGGPAGRPVAARRHASASAPTGW